MNEINKNIDFDKITDFLNTVFQDDEKSKNIIEQTGLSRKQIQVINQYIVSGLRAYHLSLIQKQD